jgi:hypothetical protein
MPKPTSYAQQDPGTPAGRIEFLLRVVWSGNQTRMAADLAVSAALISKVVRGERAPGSKLLDAVANDRRVNRLWVHEGQGEPLRAEHREAPADEFLVPVARIILPGPPGDHAGLLAGPRLPVAACFFTSSRYLLEVQAGDAVVFVAELKIAPGDLLLLETDGAVWQGNIRILNDRLCAVRTEAGDRRHLLAQARVDPRGKLSFIVYGHDGETETIIRRKPRRVRPVDTHTGNTADPLSAGPGPGPQPAGAAIAAGRPEAASAERVVAYCVWLLRL